LNERATRIVAAIGLAISLVAVTISGWAAMTVSRQQDQLRDLAEMLEERLNPGGGGVEALPMHSPPPELETEP